MTPTERAVARGHFSDPAQTTWRDWTDDRPLIAEQ